MCESIYSVSMGTKGFLLLLALNYSSVFLIAQSPNLGILPIKNFTKSEYKAGTQNWDITQDKDGLMYFANNAGLLQFDGTHWKLYPIVNKTIVRSVSIAMDRKIYVGGQGEFGYFSKNPIGELTYTSLKHLVPEKHQSFSDIWDIHFSDQGIFFRSHEAVFKLFGNDLQVFNLEETIHFMGSLNGAIIIQVGNSKFKSFHNGTFQDKFQIDNLQSPVTSILEGPGETAFITTLKNGIFKIDGETISKQITGLEAFFNINTIYSATTMPNQNYAIGTTPGGLMIFDRDWKIIRHIKKDKGIQNNNVLSIFSDAAQNLWLGLDTGLDYLETDSPFSRIYPDGENEGTAYDVVIHSDKIYFGTNTGVFIADWKAYYNPLEANHFDMVRNSSGQIWSLYSTNDHLLIGQHEGSFQVKNGYAQKLEDKSTWLYLPLEEDFLIAGNYDGLSLFQLQNGQYQFSGNFQGLNESSRIMVKGSNNNYWMSHPYRGVFKIRPDRNKMMAYFQFYDSNFGLPSDQANYVYKIKDKVVFAGETGVYEYLEEQDSFIIYKPLNGFFPPNERIKALQEDKDGNIWFAAGSDVGILKITDEGLVRQIEKTIFPGLANELVEGFELIYPFDEHNVFFGTEKGFIHLDLNKYYHVDNEIKVIISEVKLSNEDSLIRSFVTNEVDWKKNELTLSHKQNNLLFKFSAMVFGQNQKIRYQTFLEGFEDKWSTWNEKSNINYTNIPPGEYVFHIKGKNSFGIQSSEVRFGFKILPPWYATHLAYSLFAILMLGSIVGFSYFQQYKFKNEKAALQSVHEEKEAIHQEMAIQSEQEITRLRNERLEAENQHKTQELASTTMHLLQKKEMLSKIKRELEKVMSGQKEALQIRSGIRRIINLLSQDEVLDEDWSNFERNFDQVHSNFLHKLREQYPQLSPNDYKLCAYLRMNLSTKEIAPLMNISIRGVEASRYRLRKKLQIGNDVNLVDFMLNIK